MINGKKNLLKTIHYPMSIIEIYISDDMKTIYEISSIINYSKGPQHIWKEYSYSIEEYISRVGKVEFDSMMVQ